MRTSLDSRLGSSLRSSHRSISLFRLHPLRRLTVALTAVALSTGALPAQQKEPAAETAEVLVAETASATDPDAALEAAPAASSDATSLEESARKEVEELHAFFQDWFNGEVENTDEVYSRFSDVLADGFLIVVPSGHLQDRELIIEGLRSSYAPEGSEPVQLWVENFQLRRRLPDEDGELMLVTYEEWLQRGRTRRGRLSSALLRERADTPNGLEWLHVHETWLPGR